MTEHKSLIGVIEQEIETGRVEMPVFSTSAMRVQKELIKPEPDVAVVEKIISSDQSLTSQVLKIANSPFYRGLSKILTVKAAIIRLGMQEVGRISLLAASKNQFRSRDKRLNVIMKDLWIHSVAVAMASFWLAKRSDLHHLAGHAFFAGLLHDAGKLFIIVVLEDFQRRDKTLDLTDELLHETLESLHTVQGFQLMQKWNMPESYCNVAKEHHNSNFDSNDLVLTLVRIADMVSKKIGLGSIADENLVPATMIEAESLNLTEIDLAELEIMLEDSSVLAN